MKISKETMMVLKNFSTIKNSIYVDEPSSIKTQSPCETIIAVYDVEEIFPCFGIYNMSEFLGAIGLFKIEETDFEFDEEHNMLVIKSGRNKIYYNFYSPDSIPNIDNLKKAERYQSFNNFNGNFMLSQEDINKIYRSANILGLRTINITVDEGVGMLSVVDDSNPLTNCYELDIQGEGTFKISIDIDQLKLIQGDYNVFVLSDKMMKFQHKEMPLIYIVNAKLM